MPTYEYQCQACGEQLDIMQKMSDPVLTDCPKCGKSALQKLISASSFQLKGAGWYVTDYSNKSKQPAEASAKAESGADAKTDAKADTKTDTKTDAKTDTKTGAKSDSTGVA